MNNIEIQKINLIIEKKANSKLLESIHLNKNSLIFLKLINDEYEAFVKNRTNGLNDMEFYQTFSSIIKNECGYCYKLSRDLEIIINNMSKKIYYKPNIEEFDKDMIYIKFILNRADF